jgi:hypothetical protein
VPERLASLEGKDMPAAENEYVVLECDKGGYAVIEPNGQFLGLRTTILEMRSLIAQGDRG